MISDKLHCSFVWWYCDHYLRLYDPFGNYGTEKINRIIKTHIKLRGSDLRKEIYLFLAFLSKWSNDYDVLANFK